MLLLKITVAGHFSAVDTEAKNAVTAIMTASKSRSVCTVAGDNEECGGRCVSVIPFSSLAWDS